MEFTLGISKYHTNYQVDSLQKYYLEKPRAAVLVSQYMGFSGHAAKYLFDL